jgi:hypothetical protein
VLSLGLDHEIFLKLGNINLTPLGMLSYSYAIVKAMRFDLLPFE